MNQTDAMYLALVFPFTSDGKEFKYIGAVDQVREKIEARLLRNGSSRSEAALDARDILSDLGIAR